MRLNARLTADFFLITIQNYQIVFTASIYFRNYSGGVRGIELMIGEPFPTDCTRSKESRCDSLIMATTLKVFNLHENLRLAPRLKVHFNAQTHRRR
jgi:hypothetical protein